LHRAVPGKPLKFSEILAITAPENRASIKRLGKPGFASDRSVKSPGFSRAAPAFQARRVMRFISPLFLHTPTPPP